MQSDRNPLLQGPHNPFPQLQVVPGIANLDYDLIAAFQANADDPNVALECYPGGAQAVNHDVMPGSTIIGMKGVRNGASQDGIPAELGIGSIAGLNYGKYASQRQMEDEFYWIGIATTPATMTNPIDPNTPDPDNGASTIRVGTCSIPLRGPYTFYANDLACWRIPPAPFHPGKKQSHGQYTEFNGGSNIYPYARFGDPPTQFQIEYVPFDPTDFSVQLAAAFACITEDSARGGIADLHFNE
jgi:hypothetical protein